MISLSSEPIYFDYHATTPIDPRVLDVIAPFHTHHYGNPSSNDHLWGDHAETAVKLASQQIGQLINSNPRQIIFTSGATESLNLAIQGTIAALSPRNQLPRVATLTVEHKAVLDTCYALARQKRIEHILIPVDKQARLNLDDLDKLCAEQLDLLCIMAANNEVGTIYPVAQIAAIAQSHQTPYLCDATQALGKIPLDFDGWGVTMLAISGHKCYGPKGIGALIVQRGHRIAPLFYGGGQQNGLRPGTFNVPGIVGFGETCRLRASEMQEDEWRIAQQRDRLQTLLEAQIPGLAVNGDLKNRLAGNLHICVPGLPNGAIVARVRQQLAIATGSACTSGVEAPSHVLQAMQLPSDHLEGAIRIGLGKFTTDDEIDRAAQLLSNAIGQIRALL
ncbi:cysteine desulfurase [Limnothrix sp. FACHB-1083]|uniref:aminotransferase class V-fold PLP-dependent enzyme n=1 Tax=unclassified Limnothrix TaxID=2632864 RepID=UPI00167FF6C1|nr:cysteine desulfurase [Limnothrix sp. FACHB-1083]MBD2190598.1 cysteine desulfurase [Limnothrix sp. FACHB-1088]